VSFSGLGKRQFLLSDAQGMFWKSLNINVLCLARYLQRAEKKAYGLIRSHNMRILPASTESLLLSLVQPIALVGNGHPGRDLGRVIDRYPSVIRFNDYRITGHERLIGHRTTARAVNGWTDIETRDGVIAISPFTANAVESAHLADFRRRSPVPVLHASTDVHTLLPTVTKPSTGLALAALASSLGLRVDCFGFDGFASGHYWDPRTTFATTHDRNEPQVLQGLPGVTLYGHSFDYAALYDYCHREHTEYGANEGLSLFRHLQITCEGESVLEFGAGNGDLAIYLGSHGASVTAMEVSPEAFARIKTPRKILGDALSLCTLDEAFDHFVSVDVLEHLTENDVRIVVREAARLAKHITVSVCTRPSGLIGPAGENLHLTVQPVRWWLDLWGEYFDLTSEIGTGIGQLVIRGKRRAERHARPMPALTPVCPPALSLALPPEYVSRAVPDYFHDAVEVMNGVTWQPDVYETAAELARSLGCGTIVDLGCGHARKLAALHPEFRIIGIDYGANIQYCRSTYSFGSWLETNLEYRELLPIPASILTDAIIVCSDVIEHLIDPRPLLHTLRTLLTRAPAAVLTSPDRLKTHGKDQLGPPPNPAHVREWTAPELATLCAQEQLAVAVVGHTRSNDVSSELATIQLVLQGPAEAAPSQVEGMPSAQTDEAGRPRFYIPADATNPEWARAVDLEANGGVASDVRIFLDLQLNQGDVVLDLSPGFGFVSLSAATAPCGAVSVLVHGIGLERYRELRTGLPAEARLDLLAAADAETLDRYVDRYLSTNGRAFVHLDATTAQAALPSLRGIAAGQRLAAVCISDAHLGCNWSELEAQLRTLDLTVLGLAESDGEVCLVYQQGTPSSPVIAIPRSLAALYEGAEGA
jgi:2-polyprenyl-3-methyl-5-hydroxy-6-metoxy-1,4-benzoquinol methylase